MKEKFNFKDTTLLMIGGHEGWLELPKNCYDLGERVKARFKWGHNMKMDGLCSLSGLTAWLVNSREEKRKFNLVPGEGLYYEFSFLPEETGFMELLIQHEGIISITVDGKHVWGSRKEHPDAREALAFTQYAKSMVKVGSSLEDNFISSEKNLDLIPVEYGSIKIGDRASFQVFLKITPGTWRSDCCQQQ